MTNGDWTTPGVYEVVPGVHRIPLPLPNDGLRAVNVYAIVGPDGPSLVDAGWAIPQSRELLSQAMQSLGSSLGDIRRFLVTHLHRDHYSQSIYLRREFGTRVTLGPDERPSLEKIIDPDRPEGPQAPFLRELGAEEIAEEMARMPRSQEVADWELPDDWFTPGETITTNGRSLEVVSTPGHTRGHVVFYDTPGAMLFAGDHVLPRITPSIGFEQVRMANPLGAFLGSLEVVRSRPDAMLLPAHGPVAPSVHARVDELVEHHDQRLAAMSAVLGWGTDTAIAVANKVTWTRREHAFSDLDLFNRFLAVCETAAHLDLLVAQDKATRTLTDGVRHYALV